MRIDSLALGSAGANCYFVFNDDKKSVFLIDPGAEPERILAHIADYRLEAIFLTHGHFDHIGAIDAIEKQYSVPLYMHEADCAKLSDSRLNVGELFNQPITVNTQPIALQDVSCVSLCDCEVSLMHTPGHSVGSCCYLLNGTEAIFTGDTLFAGGYGRTDFEDGSFSDLRVSLKKLYFISPKRIAYPGHGESCIIGKAK